MIKIMLPKLITFVLISVSIYFGIAGVLILAGKPKKSDQIKLGIPFNELFFDYSGLRPTKAERLYNERRHKIVVSALFSQIK